MLQSDPELDNTACVETMAKQIKLFDCGVKSSINWSTSQMIETDTEPDEPKRKTKTTFVKSQDVVCSHSDAI